MKLNVTELRDGITSLHGIHVQKQGLSHTACYYTRLHIIKFTTLIISGLQSMGEWYHYFIDHKT